MSLDPMTFLRTARMVALFVPGTRPERFSKALGAGADAVIIDLEDAVGHGDKAAAREAIAKNPPKAGRVLLRINGRGTPWHEDDLALCRALDLAGILLPKAESAADMAAVGAAVPGVPLVALVESARGLAEARAIVGAPGVARLAFGSIDFAVDLGCAHTRTALAAARAELVLAARLAAQGGPIDGVTADVENEAEAFEDAHHASELGFLGKLCIHPRQVAPVFRGFAPAPEEVAWAKRVVEGFATGASVVKIDGVMVDAPVRVRAERILARAAD